VIYGAIGRQGSADRSGTAFVHHLRYPVSRISFDLLAAAYIAYLV
jgi:hypothetical protein